MEGPITTDQCDQRETRHSLFQEAEPAHGLCQGIVGVEQAPGCSATEPEQSGLRGVSPGEQGCMPGYLDLLLPLANGLVIVAGCRTPRMQTALKPPQRPRNRTILVPLAAESIQRGVSDMWTAQKRAFVHEQSVSRTHSHLGTGAGCQYG